LIDEEHWLRPPEPLERPLVVVGAVAGLFVGSLAKSLAWAGDVTCIDALTELPHRPLGWGAAFAMAIAAGVAYGVTGRVLAAGMRRGMRPGLIAIAACVLVGAIAMFVPAVARPSAALSTFAGYGMLHALICLPAVVLVLRSGTRADAARVGSVMQLAYRRATALDAAMFVVVLLAGYAWPAMWLEDEARTVIARIVLAAATIAAMVASAATIVSLRELGALVRTRWDPSDDSVPEQPGQVHDMGNGDQLTAHVRLAARPYRDRSQRLALLRGDARRARRAVALALARAGLVALGGATVLALGMLDVTADAAIESPFCP
jgi:hypothetical protein